MVQYFLDSLKKHTAMSSFSGKDVGANKSVQYSKLRKEMAKSMKILVQLELLPTQKLVYDSGEEGILGKSKTRK